MLTLTGSRAIQYWFPDFRNPTGADWCGDGGDWDWICDNEEERPNFEIRGSHDIFREPSLANWKWDDVATPDELYTMKISHIFWEINTSANWDKHAADTVFLERKGCVFLRELFDILVPLWKARYRRQVTKLDGATKDSFFADAVVRKYDHDSLHRSVAYNVGHPMYERILKSGSEVDCSWEKFRDDLTQVEKLWLMREEIMVTALERILIPNNYSGSPSAAYHWALRRCLTSLLKNEWALYCVLNLDTLMKSDVDYVQRHRDNSHLLLPNRQEA